METSNTLLALAGVAAALAGFSAIAAALRERSGPSGRADRAAATLLLESALIALALALLPLLLSALGLSGASLWVACSGTAAVLVAAQIVRGLLPQAGARPRPARWRWPRVLAHCGALALAAVNLLNAAQLWHPVAPGPYLAAAIWQVLAAALLFPAALAAGGEPAGGPPAPGGGPQV